MVKNKKSVISQNYMDGIPNMNPERKWRIKKDNLVEIDMQNTGFYNKVAQKFFHKPAVSHISLDKYGSTIWTNINGTNTIYDLVKIMENTFPDEKDKMLNRVVSFMNTLERNKFISISI